MYIPKRYGESKTNKCPFCEKDAFSQNKQKIPTCKDHKDTLLQEVKCVCGSWLDMREGKFGVFFTCINCGALNLRKVLEMNNIQKQKAAAKETTAPQYKVQIKQGTQSETPQPVQKKAQVYIRPKTLQEVEREMDKGKETVVRSDELDFI